MSGDFDALLRSIKGIAGTLQSLNQRAVREYAPIVDRIVASHSRDTNHIEHTLDGLLDFCGYEPVLALFKKLCRHYWELDPIATASYVTAYREQWDSSEDAENENTPASSEGGDT